MTETQKNKLIAIATDLVGKPYKYGADPKDAPNCFDCSSFTQYAFWQIGIELPRSGILQAADEKGKEIEVEENFSNLETGDLLFMRSDRGHYNDELFDGRKIDIGHVVMHLNDGKIINARQKKGGVIIENLQEFTQKPNYKIVLAKRF